VNAAGRTVQQLNLGLNKRLHDALEAGYTIGLHLAIDLEVFEAPGSNEGFLLTERAR